MEQVFVSLTMESSGVQSLGLKAFSINGTSVLNPRNIVMHSAKAPVISTKLRRFAFAWWMPSAVSTRRRRVSAPWRKLACCPALPLTACSGDTLAAIRAGARAASSTVASPSSTPAAMAGQLTPHTGMQPNHTGLTRRITAHSAHTTTMLRPMPAGRAATHHCSASRRTKRRICRRVAPRQRSMPKNRVRWLTLLFRLLEIIRMQEAITTSESTNATW